MKNGSFFIPRKQIYPFFNPGEMNNEEGLYLCWETDPVVRAGYCRRRLLFSTRSTL